MIINVVYDNNYRLLDFGHYLEIHDLVGRGVDGFTYEPTTNNAAANHKLWQVMEICKEEEIIHGTNC